MKQRLFFILAIALVTMFVTQQAFATSYFYVPENSGGFSHSGTMWDITSYGLGGHAYQYLVKSPSTSTSLGQWMTQSGVSAPTAFYVWIPYNLGSLDATVKYNVSDTAHNPAFSKVVNQESYSNMWVYLGSTSNIGTYVKMNNTCAASYCDSNMQVWWDDMMYQCP